MARLKLEWQKSQSSRFYRCGSSGVYNFYHYVNNETMYLVNACDDCYELSVHTGTVNNKTKTVLGKFKTSIEAKKMAETLIC